MRDYKSLDREHQSVCNQIEVLTKENLKQEEVIKH